MAHIDSPVYQFAIHDPLQPTSGIQSEVVKKEVRGGTSNWFLTRNAELAAEYKAKKPWSIVAPFEGNHLQATRPTFTMPGVPYYTRGEHERFARKFNAMYQQRLKEQRDNQYRDGA